MTTHLDTTIKAFTKTLKDGITKGVVAQGIKNIDGWLEMLEKADFRGAKTTHDNLGRLKKLLEADDLDGPAIGKLLRTLGEETARGHAGGRRRRGEGQGAGRVASQSQQPSRQIIHRSTWEGLARADPPGLLRPSGTSHA